MIKRSLLVFLLILSSQLFCKEVLVDKIIAVINDDIITSSDLKGFEKTVKTRQPKMEPSLYSHITSSSKNMLNEMISDKLIIQYAKDNNFLSSNDEINEFIGSRMRTMGMTQKDLERQLKESGQTYEDFKTELKLEKAKADIFERELKKKIEVSESDFQSFFREEFKQEVDIKEYNIKYIKFDTQDEAQQTKSSIKKADKDFDRMFSRHNGVDLGFMRLEDLMPELMEAVKSMNAGDIKGPLNTSSGYYIIKVVALKNSKNPEYLKNKDQIERALVQKNFNKLLDDWLNQRKEESYVKTYI